MGLRFFFFQAEDGIRDYKVTGVQTCALPIYVLRLSALVRALGDDGGGVVGLATGKSYELATHTKDRKSTRLNSSHLVISYAVFCLKKKKKTLRMTIGHLAERVSKRAALRRRC